MTRIAGVPIQPEVGGYVNQERALEMLGVKAKAWLHDLVAAGAIQAVYFDERTLMYRKSSIEKYRRDHPPRKRRTGAESDA